VRSGIPLRAAFVFWGVWELANAGLATFAPHLGARMVGWDPAFGWNSDVLAMSQQYGMTMFLLGLAYLLAATDPFRYAAFVWVAVAEQGLGILIGFNDTFITHSAAMSQFLIFIIVNTVIAAVFIVLRPKAPVPNPARAAAQRPDSPTRNLTHPAEVNLPT
jgi:hypothetical protein